MDFFPLSDSDFANLPRERQVIWLAMEGNTDKTIAQLLEITTETVATYWKRILVRYDSSSRTEVIAEFLREYYEGEIELLERQKKELQKNLKEKSSSEQNQIVAAAHLNSLMNMLDVGVLFTSNGHKVSYVNERLCQMAGCELSPKELIGMNIEEFTEHCKIRATRFEDTSYKRIKILVSSANEKTTDQIKMTNGQIVERTYCTLKIRGIIAGHFIVYRDITNVINEVQHLNHKNKMNEQLAKRTLAHLSARSKDQPNEIVASLGAIGKVIEANRAIIGEMDLNLGTFNVRYGWKSDDSETSANFDQSVPLSFVGWIKNQLLEQDYWIIGSLEEIPETATAERSIFIEADSQSAVALSFKGSNPNKKYFVQFASPDAHFWDKSVIELLLPLRSLLGTVIKNLELIASRTAE